MASSKEAAGSEPERKKTEASEDSGEPFEFAWVSVFAVASTNDAKTVCLHFGTVKLQYSCMLTQSYCLNLPHSTVLGLDYNSGIFN